MSDTAVVLSDDAKAERMKALVSVIELIRPVVQQDGGDLAISSVDVETGVVEVRLQGSCSSCAASSATLQGGVSRILRDRLPWVTEVIGGVEEMDFETSRSMGSGGYIPKDAVMSAESDHGHSDHNHDDHMHDDAERMAHDEGSN
jgi:Fe-S cluster biogenesis protein NfuA